MEKYTVIEVTRTNVWQTSFKTLVKAKAYMAREVRYNQGMWGPTQHLFLTEDVRLIDQWHRDSQQGK